MKNLFLGIMAAFIIGGCAPSTSSDGGTPTTPETTEPFRLSGYSDLIGIWAVCDNYYDGSSLRIRHQYAERYTAIIETHAFTGANCEGAIEFFSIQRVTDIAWKRDRNTIRYTAKLSNGVKVTSAVYTFSDKDTMSAYVLDATRTFKRKM